jgi:hypothetical protein
MVAIWASWHLLNILKFSRWVNCISDLYSRSGQILTWLNPSGHSVALGSTQPLTEMNTRYLPWWGVKAVSRTSIFWTDFGGKLIYQISSKSWELNCSMQMHGWTDRHDEAVTFHNFANAPSNWFLITVSITPFYRTLKLSLWLIFCVSDFNSWSTCNFMDIIWHRLHRAVHGPAWE